MQQMILLKWATRLCTTWLAALKHGRQPDYPLLSSSLHASPGIKEMSQKRCGPFHVFRLMFMKNGILFQCTFLNEAFCINGVGIDIAKDPGFHAFGFSLGDPGKVSLSCRR